MKKKISVTIIAKNAQKTLFECLKSVERFDEVILLDNQSSDDTLKIAREFSNVKVYQSEFIGFGALKNLAISYAKNDWILSLDSDEVVEEDLLNEIENLNFELGKYYSFSRKNYFHGKWVKCCGWYPDRVKRIFNKTEIGYREKLVHEGLQTGKAKEIKLKGSVKHYTMENIDNILSKMNRYTSLSAKEMKERGKRGSAIGGIGRFVFVFVKDYFFRMGWRYGYRGFVIAWCNASGAMFKYLKLYEMEQK
ncbi:glycosyltransferase family 2 protein [Helicobacter brantae]|uniref:Glycosyltransferase family 2 protein n=1 Tax=Helicobacter brantae TaxID=375927 RepID=A0A3D8J0V3_9HELI|nr:glycosyltransferase family 2 protein [Helicobacter brantae]RDU71147.1 glycosyltransferase family 2 protein [Helicobacter brantae]